MSEATPGRDPEDRPDLTSAGTIRVLPRGTIEIPQPEITIDLPEILDTTEIVWPDPPAPPPVNPIATAVQTWTGEVIDVLWRAIGIPEDGVWNGIKRWWAAMGVSMDERMQVEIDKAAADPDVPPSLVRQLGYIRDWWFPVDFLAFTFYRFKLTLGRLWSFLEAGQALYDQDANLDVRPALIGQDAIARAWFRSPEKQERLSELFGRWGIPDDQREIYLSGLLQLPALGEVLTLLNRGHITEDEAVSFQTKQGTPPDIAKQLLELRWFVPSPQDVVTLAGREAYEEDAIAAFELDKDIPEAAYVAGLKAGVDRETIRQFWVAHWRNPSLQQVFSMMHREARKPDGSEFTFDDLATFYKLDDINPFFGDMLSQVAYLTPGRIDIRRMYIRDIIDRPRGVQLYMHLGYNSEMAEVLMKFADEEKFRAARELTRSQLDGLRDIGIIDKQEYVDRLELIDYTPEDAAYVADLYDSKHAEKEAREILKSLEVQYKRGNSPVQVIRDELSGLHLKARSVDRYLAVWDRELITERKIPSKEDLVKWVNDGSIDAEQFRTWMRDLLYPADVIDLYIQGASTSPSKSDLVGQFGRSVIDETRFVAGLTALGYVDADIDAFVRDGRLTRDRRTAATPTEDE